MKYIEIRKGSNIHDKTPEQCLIFKEAVLRFNKQIELFGEPTFQINDTRELFVPITPDVAVVYKPRSRLQSSGGSSDYFKTDT